MTTYRCTRCGKTGAVKNKITCSRCENSFSKGSDNPHTVFESYTSPSSTYLSDDDSNKTYSSPVSGGGGSFGGGGASDSWSDSSSSSSGDSGGGGGGSD